MTDASDLWTAVKADYPEASLLTLTNIKDNSATSINDTNGEAAAQAVINLWPIYAQNTYDSTDATHVEVAEMGVIAVLWRRGGSAIEIAKIEWDEVFGDDGMISKVKRTDPRGRPFPVTNSGTKQSSELINGQRKYGWSDTKSLPNNSVLPRDVIAED